MRLALLALALAVAGCASMRGGGPTATAKLEPTKGSTTSGTVTFTQMGDNVRVVADVSGLRAGQQHGFHVHEAGDCSSGDGMSTKGHFNPQSKPHAHYSVRDRHTGDMPALQADANGKARLDTTLDVMTVTDGPNSVVGKGLIVHAGSDDYKTQPTGNAGARIACAVIQKGS